MITVYKIRINATGEILEGNSFELCKRLIRHGYISYLRLKDEKPDTVLDALVTEKVVDMLSTQEPIIYSVRVSETGQILEGTDAYIRQALLSQEIISQDIADQVYPDQLIPYLEKFGKVTMQEHPEPTQKNDRVSVILIGQNEPDWGEGKTPQDFGLNVLGKKVIVWDNTIPNIQQQLIMLIEIAKQANSGLVFNDLPPSVAIALIKNAIFPILPLTKSKVYLGFPPIGVIEFFDRESYGGGITNIGSIEDAYKVQGLVTRLFRDATVFLDTINSENIELRIKLEGRKTSAVSHIVWLD